MFLWRNVKSLNDAAISLYDVDVDERMGYL